MYPLLLSHRCSFLPLCPNTLFTFTFSPTVKSNHKVSPFQLTGKWIQIHQTPIWSFHDTTVSLSLSQSKTLQLPRLMIHNWQLSTKVTMTQPTGRHRYESAFRFSRHTVSTPSKLQVNFSKKHTFSNRFHQVTDLPDRDGERPRPHHRYAAAAADFVSLIHTHKREQP